VYSQYDKQHPRSTLARRFDICPLCHSNPYGKTLRDYGFHKYLLDCINSRHKTEPDGELCGHSSVSTMPPTIPFPAWNSYELYGPGLWCALGRPLLTGF
jgi:hypothetical protein